MVSPSISHSFPIISKMMTALMAPLVLALCVVGRVIPDAQAAARSVGIVDVVAAENTTANSDVLQTWWHDSGEINFHTAVQVGNVRQSHLYTARVKSTSDSSNTYYNSFVYENIPRNGQGNIVTPGNLFSVTTATDGVTIESNINMTQSWTNFLYSADTWVKVTRTTAANASQVIIRPSNLNLNVTDDGIGNVYIHVPYTSKGLRFSVEFKDNLYNFRDSCNTTACDYVQTSDASGTAYWASALTDETNPLVGSEPHDALLVFASPFPAADMVPDQNATETYTVYPGLVPDLSTLTNTIVYFPPGVYYMTATSHATLSSSVDWVYLAPGAYVKGAFQFTTETSPTIRATGFGVLSGEQYVYQADTVDSYANSKNSVYSLRMWSGCSVSTINSTFILDGVTTNAPPFNSIDFTGDLETIRIQQRDYKQVGAWFGQTDGTTLYSGSEVRDTFYHSNDDTIKTYGSDVYVNNVVVWKGRTAPVVQFGWAARNLSNITVDGIDVIHMRYPTNGSHPSIIGANQVYDYAETQTNTADLTMTVSDLWFGNIRAEGMAGNLMRIVPLANYENITIENVSLESSSERTNGIYESELPMWLDDSGTDVGMKGFVIRNFTIGGVGVNQAAGNIGPNALGGLNIAQQWLDSGAVTVV